MHTFIPRRRFEPTILVFERAKTVHAIDSEVTVIGKVKLSLLTDHGGPYGCETSRLPYFVNNRLTDCGEVVSFMRRPSLTPLEDSWYSFLLEAKSTLGP
jgi:hypothetical protein